MEFSEIKRTLTNLERKNTVTVSDVMKIYKDALDALNREKSTTLANLDFAPEGDSEQVRESVRLITAVIGDMASMLKKNEQALKNAGGVSVIVKRRERSIKTIDDADKILRDALNENEDLAGRIYIIKKEAEKLEQQEKRLQELKEKRDGLKKEVAALEKELKGAEKEVKILSEQRDTAETKTKQLAQKAETLKSEVKSLNESISPAEQKCESLEKTKKQLTEEHDSLCARTASLTKDTSELTAKVSELKQQRQKLQGSAETLRTR